MISIIYDCVERKEPGAVHPRISPIVKKFWIGALEDTSSPTGSAGKYSPATVVMEIRFLLLAAFIVASFDRWPMRDHPVVINHLVDVNIKYSGQSICIHLD
jgi:hypothetical protein